MPKPARPSLPPDVRAYYDRLRMDVARALLRQTGTARFLSFGELARLQLVHTGALPAPTDEAEACTLVAFREVVKQHAGGAS